VKALAPETKTTDSTPVAPATTGGVETSSRWYTEHTALLVATVKWSLLGAAAGFCVGWGTRAFLWALGASADAVSQSLPHGVPAYFWLPLALPACVWLIRTFAPAARGHGTEAVIAAVHERSGRIDWRVAPVKLFATVLTLAFGGSVGKEGPCAQIGASMTSLFADAMRLNDQDRRRLVICGIGAGFAAVFGTPVSGAIFGIEVLYLGRIEYGVLFPCLVSGIVAHLVCGVAPPVAALHANTAFLEQRTVVPLSIAFGAVFGLVALLLIETMRAAGRVLARFERRPYIVAAAGGLALAAFYRIAGDAYAGLGSPTIDAALSGTAQVGLLAFAFKILATSTTLESGGSGGIVTPIFFIGTTSGAALAHAAGLPQGVFAAFGFVSVLAAAANTPLAAAVMGLELLPPQLGVYAALCAGTAFLIVGHRSVYPSQKLGLVKSAGLDVPLGGAVGDVSRSAVQIRPGSLTEALHRPVAPRRRRPRSAGNR
jgi:H+/Cl- antiporter ClcA